MRNRLRWALTAHSAGRPVADHLGGKRLPRRWRQARRRNTARPGFSASSPKPRGAVGLETRPGRIEPGPNRGSLSRKPSRIYVIRGMRVTIRLSRTRASSNRWHARAGPETGPPRRRRSTNANRPLLRAGNASKGIAAGRAGKRVHQESGSSSRSSPVRLGSGTPHAMDPQRRPNRSTTRGAWSLLLGLARCSLRGEAAPAHPWPLRRPSVKKATP